MNSERRPGSPNEDPERPDGKTPQEFLKELFEKKKPEEAVEAASEWVLEMARKIRRQKIKSEYRRTHRPVRLHVTPFERERLKQPTTDDKERLEEVWDKVLEQTETDPTVFGKIIEDLTDVVQEHEKTDKAQTQLTPLTPEEMETQDVDGIISLVKTERTMSRKINLVEKLHPEQLDMLRQRDPGFEAVITGLSKRKARKEKAQSRILDIYQRRGEDEHRP
jgi:hypothetical protein